MQLCPKGLEKAVNPWSHEISIMLVDKAYTASSKMHIFNKISCYEPTDLDTSRICFRNSVHINIIVNTTLKVLGKDWFDNTLSYRMITVPSLCKHSFSQNLLLFLSSALYKSNVEWAKVLHPSNWLQRFLHLTIIISALSRNGQLEKGNLYFIILRFWQPIALIQGQDLHIKCNKW